MTRVYAIKNEYPNLPGWTAYVEGQDDQGPDNLCGWGATEAEAVADLLGQLEDAPCS